MIFFAIHTDDSCKLKEAIGEKQEGDPLLEPVVLHEPGVANGRLDRRSLIFFRGSENAIETLI
jgi:hypothetical protein